MFVDSINKIRGCKTQGCDGNLVPVAVKSTRLGGGLSVFFGCDGCKVKLESFTKYEHGLARNNDISVCVQVAFIVAGSVYCKTLQNALGMNTVHPNEFYETIGKMYPVVKAMVDDLCEVAKREMKDGDLGSWKRAVNTADGTWQTRGWHSKNATFTITNYLNGALLYYHHLCQKGRDKIVEGDLYLGTSKSAEGYAARITFQRAKEEGMDVAIHWQDADSSSAKAVREIYPKAEIMLCGGHASHRKILETLPLKHVDKYKDDFPVICKEEYQSCKCVYHSSGCGCLSDTFISKAHTNFTSILIEAQSQDEFVRRVKALPRHAVDDHSQCDYHPLVVCSCGACENKDQISCQGKPYRL